MTQLPPAPPGVVVPAAGPATMAEALLRHVGSTRPGLRAVDGHGRVVDRTWSWGEVLQEGCDRAAWLQSRLDPAKPPHVGLLLDNTPEYHFWLVAAALARAVVVGVNPTRRGAELERDVRHTDCQIVVTDREHLPLLDGLDLGAEVQLAEDAPYPSGSPVPASAHEAQPADTFVLLFTSGTTAAPKAVICSTGRLARISSVVALAHGFEHHDVCYLSMPMFHSNALMTNWGPSCLVGSTLVLRARFSASGFLPDVRRFGVTYWNYVGKPLAYVLATPAQPDDADNTLTRVFGNEAPLADQLAFAERFGCKVTDGYGSSEGGASVTRTPDTPPTALGRGGPGTCILDPVTGEEKPPARFDEHGRLLNAEECIGEIVNKQGAAGFEGYWNNSEADQARVRNGWYWTGDLGYQDEQGFIYFAGRDADWVRVDGENFAVAPIETILLRNPDVLMCAVYGVPNDEVGDDVMAALVLVPGATFDPERFDAFLRSQKDLGTKWAPRYVRIVEEMPMTQTNKVVKRSLKKERWDAEGVWWRPHKGEPYRPMTDDDRAGLVAAFEARQRSNVLAAG